MAVGTDQPFFVNLERFENSGVIATVDGSVGDVFHMFGPGFEFNADNGSTVAVDAFLGGPGSTADNLVINGNVTGQTVLTVNNTNPGGGALNKVGIPFVFVNGNVENNSFYLPKPIDAGAFDYDLFSRADRERLFRAQKLTRRGLASPARAGHLHAGCVLYRHRDMARPHRRSARAAEWRRSVR